MSTVASLGKVGTAYVSIELDNKQLKASFDEAKNNIGKSLQSMGGMMQSAGQSMTTYVTLPIVAAGAAVIKFGSDFESAFAGVRKTVNASEAEFGQLRDGIREMAMEIPVGTTELSAIAEAAGQLGIKTENILSFTRTMADLGVTTNLSATEAASSLARLSNIMGTNQGDFDKMGSTIVALGNNFATTEAEIVAMSMRIAGAGKQIGLTEPQVFGFATALSSLGVEAEAGGSAISRTFVEVEKAVSSGSEKLEIFADIAGQSVEEFSRSFREDAAGTMVNFIKKLGEVQDEGGSTSLVLADLGLDGIRVADSLKRAAGSGTLLNDALEMGADAWRDNTALAKEAEQRYATFESQVKILWNSLKDVAITLFDSLRPILVNSIIPALKSAVDVVSALSGVFSKLPGPMQTMTFSAIAMAAALGPIVLIGGKLATSAGMLTTAMTSLGITWTSVWSVISTTLGSIGGLFPAVIRPVIALLSGPAGIALAIGAVAIAMVRLFGDSQLLTGVWNRVKEIGAILWAILKGIGGIISDKLIGAWQALTAILKQTVGPQLSSISDKISTWINVALEAWSGWLDKIIGSLRDFADMLGVSVPKIEASGKAQKKLADETETSTEKADENKEALEALYKEADNLTASLEKTTDKTKAWADEMGAALNPGAELENQLDALSDQFNDYQIIQVHGEAIKAAWQKYRDLGQQVPENIQHFMSLIAEMERATTKTTTLKSVLDRIVSSFDSVDSEVMDLVGSVNLLAGMSIPGVITEADKIPGAFEKSFSDSKKETKSFADDFKNQVSTVVTNFAQAIGDMIWKWEGFGDALKDIGKKFISSVVSLFVEDLAGGIFDSIKNLSKGGSSGGGLFSSLLSGIGSLFSGGGGGSTESIDGYGNAVGGGTGIAGLLSKAWAGLTGGATGATGALIGLTNALFPLAVTVGMFTGNKIEPGGTLSPGMYYQMGIENTGLSIDPAMGIFGQSDLSSITSQAPGQTVTWDELSSLTGIPVEDLKASFNYRDDRYSADQGQSNPNDDAEENVNKFGKTVADSESKVREFNESIGRVADDVQGFSDRIIHGFEDLSHSTKSLIDSLKTTGLMSTQLKNLLAQSGVDSSSFALSALEAKNMGEASQQFASLSQGLGNLLPSLDLGIQDFLSSGIISDELLSYITKLGGDPDAFTAYAGLFSNLAPDQDFKEYLETNANAQQIVADVMAEAAGLSKTAEELMQIAVNDFEEAVNKFSNSVYLAENGMLDNYQYGKSSGRFTQEIDFQTKNDLQKPVENNFYFDIKTVDTSDFETIVKRKIIPILESSIRTREFAIA